MFGNTETFFGNAQSSYGAFSGAQAKQVSNLIRLPVQDPNPFDKKLSEEDVERLREEIEDKVASLRSLPRTSAQSVATVQQRNRTLNELEQLSGRLGNIDEDGYPRSFTMGVQGGGVHKMFRSLFVLQKYHLRRSLPEGFRRFFVTSLFLLPRTVVDDLSLLDG